MEVTGFFAVTGGFGMGLVVTGAMEEKINALVVGVRVGIGAKISARVVVGAAVLAIVVVSMSSVTPGPRSIGFHGT